MPRGLSLAQKTELRKYLYNPATFVELLISPAVRVWTGVGTHVVDGKTWVGVGDFSSIEGIESTLARRAGGVTLGLNDLPASSVTSTVMAETRGIEYQNKEVKIYQGFCDVTTGVPLGGLGLVEIWAGYADVMTFRAGETVSAVLTADHFSASLSRPNGLRMTSESHNARLGNPSTKDLFFEPQNRLLGRAKASV